MATDLADIGFRADTSALVDAKAKLEAIAPAAGKAERASDKLARMFDGVNRASSKLMAAANALSSASDKLSNAIGRTATASTKEARAVDDAANANSRKAKVVSTAAAATDKATAASNAAAAAARKEAAAVDAVTQSRRRAGQVPIVDGRSNNRSPWGGGNNSPMNDNSPSAFKPGGGGSNFNTANIAAQFQDIGVTSAMGMNPLQIALQQGTQLSAVITQMENPIKGLAAAFTSILSPVSLLTIGIVALVAAGLQFVDWVAVAQWGLNALADVLPQVATYAAATGAVLAIAFAPQIAAAIWAIASALIMGIMNAIILIVATIGAIPIMLAMVVAGFLIFRDEITQILGFDIVDAAKTGVNFIIGSFVAAYHDIEFLWKQFPNVIGAAAVGAANAAIKATNAIIAAGVQGLNTLIQSLNSILSIGGIGEKLGFSGIGEVSFDGFAEIANPAADALTKAVGDRNKQLQDDLTKDYLGTIGGALTTAASSAADKLREFSSGLGLDGDDKKKKKGGGGKTDGEKFEDIVNGAERTIATLQAERDAIGLSAEATARLRYETDLLNQAKQKNIALSPQQHAKLLELAAGMAKLEVETEKAKDALDFAKDITKGFISDLREGLKNGEGMWQAFSNAAMNALDKITDKLLNDVIDALFEVNSAASGGSGGGGFFAMIGKAIGSLFGGGAAAGGGIGHMALGGAFSGGVQTFAKGGDFTNSIVSRSTPFSFANGTALGEMGEAGPEAIMPLHRGPDGSLGVEMHGAVNDNRGGTNVFVDVEVNGNASVRQERSFNSNGDEVRKIIIDVVNEGTASGDFDSSQSARYGNKVQRVMR